MKIIFSSIANNERLDKYLFNIFSKYSRSYFLKLINNKLILVNNKIEKPSYKVNFKDLIEIDFIEPKKIDLTPQEIPLEVLYEDSDIIVINKPAGIVVHPSAGHYDNTIVNALLYHCKDLSSISGEIRPGIVHRLDKKTSGILIVAKNDKAHLNLSNQFKDKKIKKFYKALVFGKLKQKKGRVENFIGRHKNNRLKMSSFTNHGKLAITNFKVISYYGDFTLLDINIETGRTHQIRVHFSEMGYPIVGDDLYVNKGILNKYSKEIQNKIKELDRYFLHAYKVIFNHPVKNELIHLETELPFELKEFLSFISWNLLFYLNFSSKYSIGFSKFFQEAYNEF